MHFLAAVARLSIWISIVVLSVPLGAVYARVVQYDSRPSRIFSLLFFFLSIFFILSWVTHRVASPPRYVMRWNGPAFWTTVIGLALPILMLGAGITLFWMGYRQLGEALYDFRYVGLLAIGISQIAEAAVKIPKSID